MLYFNLLMKYRSQILTIVIPFCSVDFDSETFQHYNQQINNNTKEEAKTYS
jgi:hypothetical protein